MKKFTVIAFVCNWCSYGGADNAGSNKFPVPDELRIIRVMCSARIEPEFIIKSLNNGAAGVMILGCHPGDCHYKEGNYNTLKRFTFLKKILSDFGFENDNICLDWVSATEGKKFSEITTNFVNRLKSKYSIKT